MKPPRGLAALGALTALALAGLPASRASASDAQGGAGGVPGTAGAPSAGGGAGTSSGAAGVPGMDASPMLCQDFACPHTQPGAVPCCLTPEGPCGENFGAGCQPTAGGLPLGAVCWSPVACERPGHFCLGFESATGQGTCTVACTSNGECDAERPGAVCVPTFPSPGGPAAVCLPGCELGTGSVSGPSKCLTGACGPVTDASGTPAVACRPVCNDARCLNQGPSWKCDHRSGLCVQGDTQTGLPPGSPCTPGDPAAPCRGYCAFESGGQGRCYDVCETTSMLSCQGSTNPNDSPGAVCRLQLPGNTSPHPQDARLCAAACNCDDECAEWGTRCVPQPVPLGNAVGLCVPPGTTPQATGEGVNCDVDATVSIGQCVYGATKACRGAGGCLGSSRCLDDQSGYGECSCATSLPDAGAPLDAAADADLDASGATPSAAKADSGCGCRATGTGGASATGAVMFAALALMWRRRSGARVFRGAT